MSIFCSVFSAICFRFSPASREAMNAPSKAVSEIIRSTDATETKKQSREEWKKAKELEEARKAGTAPAEVDEEGK